MSVRADKHQRMLAELLTRPGNGDLPHHAIIGPFLILSRPDVCADCRERAPRWVARRYLRSAVVLMASFSYADGPPGILEYSSGTLGLPIIC